MSAVHKHIIRRSGGNGCLVGGFIRFKTQTCEWKFTVCRCRRKCRLNIWRQKLANYSRFSLKYCINMSRKEQSKQYVSKSTHSHSHTHTNTVLYIFHLSHKQLIHVNLYRRRLIKMNYMTVLLKTLTRLTCPLLVGCSKGISTSVILLRSPVNHYYMFVVMIVLHVTCLFTVNLY